MTGPEHYKSAENWLFKAQDADARGKFETPESCAAVAQAHATLALAFATDPILWQVSLHDRH